MLTISPSITVKIFGKYKEEAILATSFFELYRRCQWNFFRVEREHLANLENFKAVEIVEFEFDNIDVAIKGDDEHILINKIDHVNDMQE